MNLNRIDDCKESCKCAELLEIGGGLEVVPASCSLYSFAEASFGRSICHSMLNSIVLDKLAVGQFHSVAILSAEVFTILGAILQKQ